MSRVVNLKTIRFQIFNVLDSWHTNWADDAHYGHLLYEDLGIRSYFIGIFYRLRMPTNYIYLHRMSGNTLMLNTDVYFYKPFKKTKLRRYFVEQRYYLNYVLKLYLYFIPHFFSLFNSNFTYNREVKKRISFFDIIKLHQFNSMGYAGLRFKSDSSMLDSLQSYYNFSNLYSSNFLFSIKVMSMYRSFSRKKSQNRLSSLLGNFSSVLSRFFYTILLNGSSASFVFLVKYLQLGLPVKHFVFTFLTKQLGSSLSSNLSLFFPFFKKRYLNKFNKFKLKYNDVRFLNENNLNILFLFQRIRRFIVLYLRKKRVKPLHEFFVKFFYRTRRKLRFLFSFWLNSLFNNLIVRLLFKLLIGASYLFKISKLKLLYSFLFRYINLFQVQRSVCSLILRASTPLVLNINSNRVNFLNFFSRIKNIHTHYYKGKKATVNRLFAPKKFKYGHVNNHFLKIFFSYFFNHIETVVSNYTKQQVYCLYNLFYLGTKYYPPILNAKVVCDYFIYMVHGKKSIRGAFYKIRQWQLDNIQRRLSLESMYFKTQMKRSPLKYLDHLSYKKYPIMGIRIECSGNKKKGTMARKFFYGDVIKNISIVQKNPNNTFSADLDYYQSFALTKSCSIGVKVWVFFKTHLYNSHGSIKTLVVY
jgi:hypothetical protein